jgi:ankyrin repeat protein
MLQAAAAADIEALKWLLSAGADPDATDGFTKKRALHFAVLGMEVEATHDWPVAIALLLKAGADPNCCDNNGSTPLMHACCGGHANVVQLLIQGGAVLDTRDDMGMTVYMLAAVHNRAAILVELLRLSETLINAVGATGRTALHWAVAVQSTACVTELTRRRTLCYDTQDCTGETALHTAVKSANVGIVRALLSSMPANILRRMISTEVMALATDQAAGPLATHQAAGLRCHQALEQALTRVAKSGPRSELQSGLGRDPLELSLSDRPKPTNSSSFPLVNGGDGDSGNDSPASMVSSDSTNVSSDSIGVSSDSAGVSCDSTGVSSDSTGVSSDSAGGSSGASSPFSSFPSKTPPSPADFLADSLDSRPGKVQAAQPPAQKRGASRGSNIGRVKQRAPRSAPTGKVDRAATAQRGGGGSSGSGAKGKGKGKSKRVFKPRHEYMRTLRVSVVANKLAKEQEVAELGDRGVALASTLNALRHEAKLLRKELAPTDGGSSFAPEWCATYATAEPTSMPTHHGGSLPEPTKTGEIEVDALVDYILRDASPEGLPPPALAGL